MSTYTVYCHTHVETGRRYVGLTKNTMMHRWNQHCAQAKHSKGGRWHFPNAIRKYGKEAFSHRVLEVCHSIEEANEAEEDWIQSFTTRDPDFGFNIARGGVHVPHPIRDFRSDPNYRKNLSEGVKEAYRDPVYKALQAKISREVHSRPEVRRKASEATRAQFNSLEARQAQSDRVRALHLRPGYTERTIGVANAKRASKTHCKNGHEFTPENTKVDENGWRYCKQCASDRVCQKAYDAKTGCKNGHEFREGSFRFVEGTRKRVCLLCVVTHCKRDHEFTPENTELDKRGSKVCKECRRIRGRIHDAARRRRRRVAGYCPSSSC